MQLIAAPAHPRAIPGGVADPAGATLYLALADGLAALDPATATPRWHLDHPGRPLLADGDRLYLARPTEAGVVIEARAAADGAPLGESPRLDWPLPHGEIDALHRDPTGALLLDWRAESPAAGPARARSAAGRARWQPGEPAWQPIEAPPIEAIPSLAAPGQHPFALADGALGPWRVGDLIAEILMPIDAPTPVPIRLHRRRAGADLAPILLAHLDDHIQVDAHITTDRAHVAVRTCDDTGCRWRLIAVQPGTPRAQAPGGDDLSAPATVIDDTIYWPVGTPAHAIAAIDLTTGAERWRRPLASPPLPPIDLRP